MVKGTKNNRRKRVRVRQKAPRDAKKKFFKADICREEMRDVWDNRKTPKENMANIGALADPNDIQSNREGTNSGEKKPIEYMKVADIVDLAQVISASRPNESKRGKHRMTEDEIAYIKPLVDKYGENIKKMVRDLKLNYKQLTANVISRRVQRYHEFMKFGGN